MGNQEKVRFALIEADVRQTADRNDESLPKAHCHASGRYFANAGATTSSLLPAVYW
jgi:hypothetical protein